MNQVFFHYAGLGDYVTRADSARHSKRPDRWPKFRRLKSPMGYQTQLD